MLWIDITNLPHVLFFRGLIKELKKEGQDILVTARKFGALEALLEENEIEFVSAGEHGGDKKDKLIKSAERVKLLAEIVSKYDVKAAASKHSVELPRAAFGLGMPCVQVCDNEYAEAQNRLALPLASLVISPQATNQKMLERQGANKEKIKTFYGVCELAHIANFRPEKSKAKEFGGEGNYIVIRPEPVYASYFESSSSTRKIIELLKKTGFNLVVVPRGSERFAGCTHFKAEDGDTLNLIYHARALFSGGGTMNREAAVLGTPAFSFYPQELLGADRFLIKHGLIKHINLKAQKKNLEEEIEKRKEQRKKAEKIVKKFENPVQVIKNALKLL